MTEEEWKAVRKGLSIYTHILNLKVMSGALGTGKCPQCGTQMELVYPSDGVGEPVLFCSPCYERTGEM